MRRGVGSSGFTRKQIAQAGLHFDADQADEALRELENQLGFDFTPYDPSDAFSINKVGVRPEDLRVPGLEAEMLASVVGGDPLQQSTQFVMGPDGKLIEVPVVSAVVGVAAEGGGVTPGAPAGGQQQQLVQVGGLMEVQQGMVMPTVPGEPVRVVGQVVVQQVGGGAGGGVAVGLGSQQSGGMLLVPGGGAPLVPASASGDVVMTPGGGWASIPPPGSAAERGLVVGIPPQNGGLGQPVVRDTGLVATPVASAGAPTTPMTAPAQGGVLLGGAATPISAMQTVGISPTPITADPTPTAAAVSMDHTAAVTPPAASPQYIRVEPVISPTKRSTEF